MDDAIGTASRLAGENLKVREILRACLSLVDYWELAEHLEAAREGLTHGQPEAGNDKDFAKASDKAIDLDRMLAELDRQLKSHFSCEEELALNAIAAWNIPELVIPAEDIIEEHERILKNTAELRKNVAELIAANIGVSTRRYDIGQIRMKIYRLSHLIKSHTDKEETLLREITRLAGAGIPPF